MSKKAPKARPVSVPTAMTPPLEPITVQPTEGFKAAVVAELLAIEQAYRDAHRVPAHTMYGALVNHLSDTLNALYKDGRIAVGIALNDKYITVTPSRPNE